MSPPTDNVPSRSTFWTHLDILSAFFKILTSSSKVHRVVARTFVNALHLFLIVCILMKESLDVKTLLGGFNF